MLPKRSSPSRAAESTLRIISGSLRGSKLPVPTLPGLRPTPDRVRETLFNWLRPTIPGARVLDLFAGSGALGIEALSLGARQVEFVEANPVAAQSLQTQVQRLKIAERCHVRSGTALVELGRMSEPFDLILLDPPYAQDLWNPCLEQIAARGLLAANGVIYVEWPEPGSPPNCPGYVLYKRARAAAVGFGLLRSESEQG